MNCWPKPIQKPHPPIYIPGGGSIETFDFCLDYDYNYSYLSFNGYLSARGLMDQYWERIAARGKDESPHRAAFAQIICRGRHRRRGGAAVQTTTSCTSTTAACTSRRRSWIRQVTGRSTPSRRRRSVVCSGRVSARVADVTWQMLVDGGMVIAGSPETVRQRMEELIKTLRVGHVFCLLHTGDQPDDKTRHNTGCSPRK